MATTKTKTPPKRKPTSRGGAASMMKAATAAPPAAAVALELDAIDPAHFTNPRGPVDEASPAFSELVDSIRELDVLQPIVVGPALVKSGKHPLLAGWRRYHAARVAGLPSIPVRQVTEIREAKDALVAAIAENVARDDMTPLAEARAIDTLMREHGLTQVAAGKRIGMSERTVRERLRLLSVQEASPVVAQAMSDQVVPVRAATWVADLARLAPDVAERLVAAISDPKSNFTPGDLVSTRYADEVLDDVLRKDGQTPLVDIARWVYADALPFPAPKIKALGKPAGIRLPDDVVQQAIAQGFAVRTPAGGAWAGPTDWLYAAIKTELEREEAKRVASKAADEVLAAPTPAPPERSAEEIAADKAAKRRATEKAAWAARANTNLVRALLTFHVDADDPRVVALLLTLATEGPPSLEHVVSVTLGAVDPMFRGDKARELVETVAEAGARDHATLIVRAYAAGFLLDRSVLKDNAAHYADRLRHTPTARAAAELASELVDVPDRCWETVAARETYWQAEKEWRELPKLRRLLWELNRAAIDLPSELLAEQARRWDDQTPEGIADSVYGDIDTLIAQLGDRAWLASSEVENDEGVIKTRLRITDAGTAALATPLPPEPTLADVDPAGPPPSADKPAAPKLPALEAVKDPDLAAGDAPATSPALSPPESGSFSAPTGPVTDRVIAALRDADDWISRPEIARRAGISPTSASESLRRLRAVGLVETMGATRALRYRICRVRHDAPTPSPADVSAAPAKTPPQRPTRPRTSPDPSRHEDPMGGARSAGEEPSKPAPPKVSARVRKQLERDAAAAELADDLLGPVDPVMPEPVPVPPASIAELVLKQLALYDEPVTARTIAQACFRNQHDVAQALRELATSGRCSSQRCDGITLYIGKGAA